MLISPALPPEVAANITLVLVTRGAESHNIFWLIVEMVAVNMVQFKHMGTVNGSGTIKAEPTVLVLTIGLLDWGNALGIRRGAVRCSMTA